MKRDMDLIREILLFFEENDEMPYGNNSYSLFEQGAKYGSIINLMANGDDKKGRELDYNFIQLINAGYINVLNPEQDYPIVNSLTWSGNDLLENIKNEYIWDEVKNKIKENGLIGASVDVIKDLANQIIRKKIGMMKDSL